VRTTFPPERVELRFSEPVEAEFDPVVVRAADGARVDAHDARVDPEEARIVLADLESVPREPTPPSGVSPP
jgi:methionine-rich copper-binding protein CopC